MRIYYSANEYYTVDMVRGADITVDRGIVFSNVAYRSTSNTQSQLDRGTNYIVSTMTVRAPVDIMRDVNNHMFIGGIFDIGFTCGELPWGPQFTNSRAEVTLVSKGEPLRINSTHMSLVISVTVPYDIPNEDPDIVDTHPTWSTPRVTGLSWGGVNTPLVTYANSGGVVNGTYLSNLRQITKLQYTDSQLVIGGLLDRIVKGDYRGRTFAFSADFANAPLFSDDVSAWGFYVYSVKCAEISHNLWSMDLELLRG